MLVVNLYGNKLNNYHRILIKKYHYLHTWKSLKEKYVFELLDEGEIVGLAVFGQPCSANVEKKYGMGTLELRRFYCLDHMPYNTESWFLSRCLKILRKTIHKCVVTYSDPNQGHFGTIYKATNFKYLGKENSINPRVCIYKGKRISMREFYQKTKDKSKYQPKALLLQSLVKKGKARIKKLKRKDIFLYELNKDIK